MGGFISGVTLEERFISFPRGDPYGYVILTGACSALVHTYLSIKVGLARRKHKIPLPDQYSADNMEFNCYQRAYLNMVECYPAFVVLLLAAGDKYPRVSATAGTVWVVSRIVYAYGYYTGDPEKAGAIALLGILIACGRIWLINFDRVKALIMGGRFSYPRGDPYGYIILTGACSALVHTYLSIKVGLARRKHKIPLPDQYSADNMEFNCYQRAYMNMVENYPVFVVLLFAGGDKYPKATATAGAVWILSRIIYAHGYYTGDPGKRELGGFGFFAMLTMLGCAVASGVSRLRINSC